MFKPFLCSIALLSIITLASPAQESTGTPDSSQLELEHLKGVVNDLNESATEYRTYVDFLRKIKLTGYIQAQYRATDLDGAAAPASGGNFPANTHQHFQIRRGRLKVNYDNVLSQYVLQIDVTTTGVTVKDAFVSLIEPWWQSFGLQVGVFDRPFGYEISYSSSMRESPERSRVFQTLFPGERDLGAKLFYAPQIGSMSFLRVDAGFFNGTGSVGTDYDNFKDFIAHAGVQIPFEDANASLDFGVSGYLGNVRNNTKYLWKSGSPTPGVPGMVLDSSDANQGAGVPRQYLGFDAQLYYDLPILGGMSLRGEVLTGIQPGVSDSVRVGSGIRPTGRGLSTASPSIQNLGPVYQRNFLGWYVSLVQNLGSSDQIIVKYDRYDPNSDVTGSDIVPGSNLSSTDLAYTTLGFGLVHHWDEHVKFTLYYEVITNETVNPVNSTVTSLVPFLDDIRDNVFTFRTQFRF